LNEVALLHRAHNLCLMWRYPWS